MAMRMLVLGCSLAALCVLAVTSDALAQTAVVVVPGVRPAYAYPAYPYAVVRNPRHAYRHAVRHGYPVVAPVVPVVPVDRFGHPFYGPTRGAAYGAGYGAAVPAPSSVYAPPAAPQPAPQAAPSLDGGIQTTSPELIPIPVPSDSVGS